jgi:hypothetical protein
MAPAEELAVRLYWLSASEGIIARSGGFSGWGRQWCCIRLRTWIARQLQTHRHAFRAWQHAQTRIIGVKRRAHLAPNTTPHHHHFEDKSPSRGLRLSEGSY